MPKDKYSRKADSFAGQGSLADKLRKRRRAIEQGDPSGGKKSGNADHRKALKHGYTVEEG